MSVSPYPSETIQVAVFTDRIQPISIFILPVVIILVLLIILSFAVKTILLKRFKLNNFLETALSVLLTVSIPLFYLIKNEEFTFSKILSIYIFIVFVVTVLVWGLDFFYKFLKK